MQAPGLLSQARWWLQALLSGFQRASQSPATSSTPVALGVTPDPQCKEGYGHGWQPWNSWPGIKLQCLCLDPWVCGLSFFVIWSYPSLLGLVRQEEGSSCSQ